jgi:hydroxymethylpyrimidine/phosphomethylpyrimidine kinase
MTIAGSDPSGGAGVQADLKTFHQHGVYGTSVLTLLTVQNTRSVDAVRLLEPDFVISQLDAILCDIPPGAAKTGALGSAAIIEAVAERAARFSFPLIVDPVMISKHGAPLLDGESSRLLKRRLLPHAHLVTPNLAEARELAEIEVTDDLSMERAAAAIADLGPENVLIKGGASMSEALDLLWSRGRVFRFPGERIDTRNTQGTGCVFSAAITARLARGEELTAAIGAAKEFVTRAIRSNPRLGGGFGPVDFHASCDP